MDRSRPFSPWMPVFLALLVTNACGPEGDEPAQVTLPVVAAGDELVPCTNDLGWEVSVSGARVAVGDIEFTIEGETHAAATSRARGMLARLQPLARWLLPEAMAHPGHQAGGEVTGELPGSFLADLSAGTELGLATLLEGDYHGMNLSFRTAGASDGLPGEDPLSGHTALLEGVARKDGRTVDFHAQLDVQEGLQMVGGPFVLAVREGTVATLALVLYTIDPSEFDTLFDGLDFGALDEDDDGQVAIAPGTTAHNILAKTLVRHDHWGIVVR